MADSKRYDDWFNKAETDLKGANILLEHDGSNDLVAFHCQQAMEKALKGWILKNTGELVDGHSLVYTRYPADIPMEVTIEETQECVQIATEVLALLNK